MNTKAIINITKAITAATVAAATPIIAAGIGVMSERRRRYSAETISDTTINCAGRKRFYGKRFVNCTLTNVRVLDRRYFECCKFENCRFENTQPTECSFNECAFEHCTFRNVLFLKCHMVDCSFEHCTVVACNYDCGLMNNVIFIRCETADCGCAGSVISEYTFDECRNHMWHNYTSTVLDGKRYVTVTIPSDRERAKYHADDDAYESIKASAKGWDEPFAEPDERFSVRTGDIIINGVTKDDIQPMGYVIDDEDEDPFM